MKKKILLVLFLVIIVILLIVVLKKNPGRNSTVIVDDGYSWIDKDSDGKKGTGDKIIINDEEFFVISNKDGVIRALAKYNLMIGNKVEDYDKKSASLIKVTSLDNPSGLQDEKAIGCKKEESTCYGTIEFSEGNNWEDNEDITVDQISGPVHDALIKYQNKVKYPVSFITLKELENLGCDISNKECTNANDWVYGTSYWIGSSYKEGRIWTLNRNAVLSNHYLVDNKYPYGIRPVITIGEKTNNINNITNPTETTTVVQNNKMLVLNQIYYDKEEDNFEKNSKPKIMEDELGYEYTSQGLVSYIKFREDGKADAVINDCMGFDNKSMNYNHYEKDGKEFVELKGFYDNNVVFEVVSSKELKKISGDFDCGDVIGFKLYEK